MAEDHAESQITVQYSRDFHVSGRRVLTALSSIDGVGGGHRNATHLVLPVIPIIAKKTSGSGYQLLNFGDSRVTSQLSEFNSSTMIECLLVSENIEQVRSVTGEIYPQICTKVPTASFLKRLAQSQSLRQLLSDFFDCPSSHQSTDFSVSKLAKLLAPNGPSKATIDRALKNQKAKLSKNPESSETATATLDEHPTSTTGGIWQQTGEDLLTSTQPESVADPGAEARKKWCTFFNRDPGEFAYIEAGLKDIETKNDDQAGSRRALFYQRITEAKDNDALRDVLKKIHDYIETHKGQ